jgi:hypothetical protein
VSLFTYLDDRWGPESLHWYPTIYLKSSQWRNGLSVPPVLGTCYSTKAPCHKTTRGCSTFLPVAFEDPYVLKKVLRHFVQRSLSRLSWLTSASTFLPLDLFLTSLSQATALTRVNLGIPIYFTIKKTQVISDKLFFVYCFTLFYLPTTTCLLPCLSESLSRNSYQPAPHTRGKRPRYDLRKKGRSDRARSVSLAGWSPVFTIAIVLRVGRMEIEYG